VVSQRLSLTALSPLIEEETEAPELLSLGPIHVIIAPTDKKLTNAGRAVGLWGFLRAADYPQPFHNCDDANPPAAETAHARSFFRVEHNQRALVYSRTTCSFENVGRGRVGMEFQDFGNRRDQ